MLAKELMRRDVRTIEASASVDQLIDLMVQEHLHGCPVVNSEGVLVGIVTQQDVFFSGVTNRVKASPADEGATGAHGSGLVVRDVMTSPAVSAEEETDVLGLCRMMHRLRIHRVPIVKDGKVSGIVSSLDILERLASGGRWPGAS